MVKFKRSLLRKTQTNFKMTEQQIAIVRQHESTCHRARSGKNIIAVGPWTRDSFPLLKLEEKDKEFFIRTGKFTILRYYLDEYRQQINEQLFYPTDKAIAELEFLKKTGKGDDDNFMFLYNKLLSDGQGSAHARRIVKNNKKKITLKRIEEDEPEKPKRFQLKSVNNKKLKRIPLKSKAKKIQLRKK